MKPISLNGTWSFLASTSQETYFESDIDSTNWDLVPVPSNWNDYSNTPSAWYRREFEMPANDDCSVWWLECQAVNYHCQIWLNGQFVGEHWGGFTRFRFDVTPYVQLETNQITLKVALHKPQDGGGVWGDLELKPYDCLTPPQTDDWYLPSTKPVLHLDRHWWRGDAPYFLRMIGYNPSLPLSTAQMANDLQLIQAANFNTIYLDELILPKAFYDLCARLGLFVWQNFPDSRLDESTETILIQAAEMVQQLRHHPSIIVWGLAGEHPLKPQLAEHLKSFDPHRQIYLFNEEIGWAWDETWRVRQIIDSEARYALFLAGYNRKNEAVYKEWVEFLRWHKPRPVIGIINGQFFNTISEHHDWVNGIVELDRKPNDGYSLAKIAMQPLSPLALIPREWYKNLPLDQELSFEVGILNDLPERFEDWSCRISLTSWIPSEELKGEATYLYHWRHSFERFSVEPCSKLPLGEVTIPPAKRRKAQYQLVLQLYDTKDDHAPMIVNIYVLQPA